MTRLLDFIDKANKKFSYKYDYSLFIYKNVDTPSYIMCKVHGWYKQSPYKHIHSSAGCPKCSRAVCSVNKIKTTKWFIDKAIIIHNNKYLYDKTLYINAKSKLLITCKIHGDFEQIASGHLSGYGCSKCVNYGKGRTKISEKCILYYFNINGTNCYKLGITSLSISKRYRTIQERELINIIFTKEYNTGSYAYNLEQYIINKHIKDKYNGPKLLINGNTEIFNKDIFNGNYNIDSYEKELNEKY